MIADAGPVERALAIMTLQAGYNSAVVVLGVAALGLACGPIGVFMLLRRRALVSDALSHSTLPGIALAFLAALALGGEPRSLPLLLAGAAASGWLGVLAIQFVTRATRLPEDAAIGAVLSVFFGIGIVLLSYIQTLPTGAQAGLKSFILGQTAAMNRDEAVSIAVLALAAAACVALFFKEFRLVCFDAGFARGLGLPVARIDLLMMALVTLIVVIGLRTVGLILIIALLIVPAATARLWSENLAVIAGAAALAGALSGYAGATLSALQPSLPAGSVIVLCAGALFFASLIAAPRRGVIAAMRRRRRRPA